ncbi:MAG: hypothetical protein M0R03_13855 [Novosphingobium sp.]|nr:hypothetical protein [Novosphingobium sp.]
MAILLLFLLGVANFAMHKAVLESGHPLLTQAPWFVGAAGGWGGLAMEFLMLLGAMALVAEGSTGWAWGYAAYSLLNAGSAWMILSGRF